jgi:hypothetical protein
MSRSPSSVTPSAFSRIVPRDPSSEPRPVAGSHVWAYPVVGVIAAVALSIRSRPLPLARVVSEGIGAAVSRNIDFTWSGVSPGRC